MKCIFRETLALNLDKMGLVDIHWSKYQAVNQATKHILNKTKVLMGKVHSYLAYVMSNESSLFPRFRDVFLKTFTDFSAAKKNAFSSTEPKEWLIIHSRIWFIYYWYSYASLHENSYERHRIHKEW